MRRYTNNLSGWMSDIELSWLYEIAHLVDSVVEIGSWKGKSTDALCAANHAKVSAVDHFMGSEFEREGPHKEAANGSVYRAFLQNVGHYPHLTVYKMSSKAAAKRIKEADVVFIDGGHTYEEVKEDIALWKDKAKKIVSGHDYGWEGVNRAVKEAFGDDIKTIGSIWIHEKA